ncbi:hypothetical protein M0R45_016569 [Rubus argutus]|uniref:ABC transporter domain-containing protein n=1 Tax=Rubus argutus TaxID=59490 RepID=A0AAW1XTR1_RUBAR
MAAAALAGDDLARHSSSRRSWGSTSVREMWNAPDVFQRSAREPALNEEEELKWAAIERLPTYDRMKRGMLRNVMSNGRVVAEEVDVHNLGAQDKRQLMESILKVIEEDNEKFLKKLRARNDRVGIDIPKVEVRFQNLSIEGDAFVGTRALPTLLNSTLNALEGIIGLIGLSPSKKRVIKILQDVSGIVKPARMTLLLGPPGSGKNNIAKSTFGKTGFSCVLTSGGCKQVTGKVTYCGHEFNEFVPQRTSAYISQHDLHYGEMTVRETFDFSGRCLGVGTRYDILAELSRREKDAGIKPDPAIDAYMKATSVSGQETSLVTDYTLKILGLDICADTLVGDDMRRGISGGQKKRVTTGEIIPVSVLESVIWIGFTYYTIGFAPDASRFFKQLLAYIGISQMALSLFRFIAALGRSEVVANTLGSFTLLLVFVLGGYIVAKQDIQSWMIWGYYVSPMMYGQNAIAINEFLDKRWGGPPINSTQPTAGKALLKQRGLYTEEYWFWICIAALFGFSVLFNLLFIAALSFLNPPGGNNTLIEEDDSETKRRPQLTEGIDMQVQNAQGSTSSNGQAKRGMVLPFQPLSLAFNHVNYYVDMPAEMKSQDVNKSKRKMFVDEVMDLVELNPLRNALVGLPGVDGLSTEQRKRLTIAVELVANPSIIFMDEPTSGLDARAAAIVMRTVRNTVDTGRTVVCTIHQPSIDIFEAFDELFLMKRGGQVIYAGPLGRQSHKLVEYFEAIPGVPKIKEGYNPATWMLEVSSAAVEAQNNIDFAEIYANSELYRSIQELIKELGTPLPGSQDLHFPTKYSQSFPTQCKACFWKQHWSYWRNSRYNAIRFFVTMVIGVLFGVIFWGKGDKLDSQQDMINLMGATYSAVLFLGASNASSVQSVVSIERTVFYRERAAGMYSELPYAFAQVAIETIYVAVQCLIYCALLYSMIGYSWKVEKVLYFYYFIFMCFTYFSMYGMMLVSLTPGNQIAAICMGFFMSFWNLFSGFLISRPQIPIWWRWYYWGSPVAWTIYGVITSQFGDLKQNVTTSTGGSQQLDQFIKDNWGYDHDFLIPVLFAHIGWVLLFFFVFAYGIKFLNFQRR